MLYNTPRSVMNKYVVKELVVSASYRTSTYGQSMAHRTTGWRRCSGLSKATSSGDDSVFHDIIKSTEADVFVLYGVIVEVLWRMGVRSGETQYVGTRPTVSMTMSEKMIFIHSE